MKTILVPTDFSKAAGNAIDYAVEMAKLTNVKMILFHVYHPPVIVSDVPVIPPSMEEIEKNCVASLERVKAEILEKRGIKSPVECKAMCGLAADEINSYARESKVDLIIMGMQGSGYLAEKIIGSVTTSLIKKASCPVLSVDDHVKFRAIKKIVLASDFKETTDQNILNPLKEIAGIFKSHVYVLNVVPELIPNPTIAGATEGIKLEHALEGINHSFDFAFNEDVVEGINDFVLKEEADMVVMIPHERSILKNLFQGSTTKHMAFHTHIPLLALH